MARRARTFNVAVDFWRHPKATAAGRDGRGIFLCSIAWATEQKTDGHLPESVLRLLAGMTGISMRSARQATARLVEAGLWHVAEDGWQIHDYCGPAGWQLSADEYAARRTGGVPYRLRRLVLERDGLVCGLCGDDVDPDDVHIDHVRPVARVGTDALTNLQVAHSSCNIRKGATWQGDA